MTPSSEPAYEPGFDHETLGEIMNALRSRIVAEDSRVTIAGDPAQLIVDDRHQPIESRLFSAAPIPQQLCDVLLRVNGL